MTKIDSKFCKFVSFYNSKRIRDIVSTQGWVLVFYYTGFLSKFVHILYFDFFVSKHWVLKIAGKSFWENSFRIRSSTLSNLKRPSPPHQPTSPQLPILVRTSSSLHQKLYLTPLSHLLWKSLFSSLSNLQTPPNKFPHSFTHPITNLPHQNSSTTLPWSAFYF